jgi:hypothetical protein
MTYQQIETQKTLKTGPNALSPHKRAKSENFDKIFFSELDR